MRGAKSKQPEPTERAGTAGRTNDHTGRHLEKKACEEGAESSRRQRRVSFSGGDECSVNPMAVLNAAQVAAGAAPATKATKAGLAGLAMEAPAGLAEDTARLWSAVVAAEHAPSADMEASLSVLQQQQQQVLSLLLPLSKVVLSQQALLMRNSAASASCTSSGTACEVSSTPSSLQALSNTLRGCTAPNPRFIEWDPPRPVPLPAESLCFESLWWRQAPLLAATGRGRFCGSLLAVHYAPCTEPRAQQLVDTGSGGLLGSDHGSGGDPHRTRQLTAHGLFVRRPRGSNPISHHLSQLQCYRCRVKKRL